MKYCILNFYQLIKKHYLLISGMYIALYIILLLIFYPIDKTITSFNTILGCPPINNTIQILWLLFQISCHVYITYSLLSFEQDSSQEYSILREAYYKTYIKKFILIIFFTLIIRNIIFFITYMFYYKSIVFPIQILIFNTLIYMIISMIIAIITPLLNKE